MTLEEKIKLMEQYLTLKIEERDFHGVADAAMDLRELEAVKKYRSELQAEITLKPHQPNLAATVTIKNLENWSLTKNEK